MRSHKIMLALSLLSMAALMPVPVRAATPVSTSRFSLTFPTGWQVLPLQAASDSAVGVTNAATKATCLITLAATSQPLTAQQLEMYIWGIQGTSAKKVTNGTKTLGDRAYTYAEYDAGDTATDTTSRVRAYYFSIGTNLFGAILFYDSVTGAGAVPDLESALATLSLTGTSIRAWAARIQSGLGVADQDVLGRSRLFPARTALFRLPSR